MGDGYNIWNPEIMKRISKWGPMPFCESQTKIGRRFSIENLLKSCTLRDNFREENGTYTVNYRYLYMYFVLLLFLKK